MPSDWFPMRDSNQQNMVESFIELLRTQNLIPVKHLSLEAEWARTGPEQYRNMTLEVFLDKVKRVNDTGSQISDSQVTVNILAQLLRRISQS